MRNSTNEKRDFQCGEKAIIDDWEILPHSLVELIVADSDSEDGTKDVAKEILEESALENDRWKIMSFDVRGKMSL